MSTKFGSGFRSSPSVTVKSQDFLQILQSYREEGVITKYLTDVTHRLKDHEDFITEFGHFLTLDVCLTCVCCSGSLGRRARLTPFLLGSQVLVPTPVGTDEARNLMDVRLLSKRGNTLLKEVK